MGCAEVVIMTNSSTTDMPFANLLDAMLECLGASHH
jgi:hypothetical protein